MLPRLRVAALATVLVVAGAACSGSGSDQARRVETLPGGSKPVAAPQRVVQLGDSIASGEGTLYGYTYDASKAKWVGGDINVPWPPPYPLCHISPDAYGNKVASAFGATFTQFACTGATFDVGISGPMTVSGVNRRPAEFGNWDTQQDLNADYDAANPDLVLITLGADDVEFREIIVDCVKNSYKHYFFPKTNPRECVDGNPGDSVKKHFFGNIDTLKKSYTTLVKWIAARAEANNTPVPKVIFTTYANPLPNANIECNDSSYLYDEQVQYLATLLVQMNGIIKSTINGLGKNNVGVADIERAYQPAGVDHRWCSDDPWAYGLSIYRFTDPSSFRSGAPFHATPDGQEAIAEGVIAAATDLFNTTHPVDTTSTTGASTTTPTTSTPSTSTTAPSTTTSSASTSTTTSTTAP